MLKVLEFELAGRIETANARDVRHSSRPVSALDDDKDLHCFCDELRLRRHVGTLCQTIEPMQSAFG
jgi:hypothetical protein